MATTVVSKAKRIAGLLRTWAGNWGRVSLVVSLVNCFTIAVNIEGGPQNGSPPKTQLPHAIAFRAVTSILGRHFPTPSVWRPSVQRTLAMLALIASVATTAQAQSWHSEFGLQSGYSRIKAAGTKAPDHIDVFGVPGFNLPGVLPGGASLFAILPWKNKIAVETSL